jgi:hypothetical protein
LRDPRGGFRLIFASPFVRAIGIDAFRPACGKVINTASKDYAGNEVWRTAYWGINA